MVMLTLLMRTVNLDEAASIYKKLHILLCTQVDNKTVRQALDDVTRDIKQYVPDEDNISSIALEENVVDKDARADVDEPFKHESTQSIKEQSPFTQLFADVLEDVYNQGDSVEAGKQNNLYNPAAFTVITEVVHLYPLWAAALHDDVRRFACDVTTNTPKTSRPKCRSNAIVESHFKSVKHARKISCKIRPRLFLINRLRSVLAKVNEAAIKFPSTRRKRRSVHHDDDPASTPEVWNRTPKRRRYGDKDVSLRVLEDINPGLVRKFKKVFLLGVLHSMAFKIDNLSCDTVQASIVNNLRLNRSKSTEMIVR